MKRWSILGLLLVLTTAMVPACAGGSPATLVPEQKVAGQSTGAKADWEQKWDSIVAGAKKEGAVSIIITAWTPRVPNALTPALKARYGIDLEYTPTTRGVEQVAKIRAEQRAGLFTYDFFGTGSTTAINIMKPEGILGPIEPYLVLPEVKDPSRWRNGRLPFVDKDKLFLGMAASKQHYLVYNTSLVKKGEITSYKDILRPEYAGKIIMNDPSTSGAGAALFAHLALDIWNMEEARDYLRQLLKQQKAVIERDNRLHIEAVARGKYPIALGTSPEVVATFIDAGAPIEPVVAKEGTNVTSAAAGVTLPTRFAHPNAAVFFLNWLLSKEGQTVFGQAWGTPTMRVDAAAEGINPLFQFQPGEKIFPPSEEKSLLMGEWTGIAQKIIEEASK